jgi:hypothetical protein
MSFLLFLVSVGIGFFLGYVSRSIVFKANLVSEMLGFTFGQSLNWLDTVNPGIDLKKPSELNVHELCIFLHSMNRDNVA